MTDCKMLPCRRLVALFFAAAAPFSAAPASSPLSDTGQTAHYTRTFGEDSDYATPAPAYVDNGDGTVTDRVSGLIWQQVDGGEMTWEKARTYASNLTLAGRHDWRLPNSLELFSILNHEMNRPAMDTTFFPRTDAEYWWTDATRADEPSKVWAVNAGGGIGAHPRRETLSAGGDQRFHVRCVRGASPFASGPRLTDRGDGTVADAATGLIWQKVPETRGATWEQALHYCASLSLAGQNDWRLPNIKELRSLSDDRRVNPSFDRALFPDAAVDFYWSSTTQWRHPERAWYVDFTTGLVTYADKPEKLFVFAVRGGNAVPSAIRNKLAPDPALLRTPRGPRPGEERGERPRPPPPRK